jgi:hypothetical protein
MGWVVEVMRDEFDLYNDSRGSWTKKQANPIVSNTDEGTQT